MSWLALSFGTPALLFGLLALPVIWWLLRLTPPRPQTELFPPLRILARVMRREETPHKSPWWLTLLRMAIAALVILALAQPVMNPRERMALGGGPLALVIDNGWASAPDWDIRAATAGRLIDDAAAASAPVILAFTAERENAAIGPFDAAEARERLNAAAPRPVPTDRPAVLARVAAALGEHPGATLAILGDGLAADGDAEALEALFAAASGRVVWITPDRLAHLGVTGADNLPDAFAFTAIRAPGDPAPRQAVAAAFDERGRRLAEAPVSFGMGETQAQGAFRLPFELRNDFASIALDGENQAAAMRVLDESARRRRVGLVSGADADGAQPLLAPLHYISRALGPFADLIEPQGTDLAAAMAQILEQQPAMIVMADVGVLPEAARAPLVEWLAAGGTLVRFAGSRLAGAENDDELLPVRLRLGERALGGTLSWTEPQPVAEFPANSPFADLQPPSGVTVSRQVLAEPGVDIVERTWAQLADGTPLVTGARRGDGTLVLFHVTPEATWSNLPISGTFVEMLRRLAQSSRNQGTAAQGGEGAAGTLAPYRMIGADGRLSAPGPDARPLPASGAVPVTLDHPPGLYGGEDGVAAHNLLAADAAFAPLLQPPSGVAAVRESYAFDETRDLRGLLIALALLLMALDGLAVLWTSGRRPAFRRRAAAAGALAALVLAGTAMPPEAAAQDAADAQAVAAITQTRIAYVMTGDSSIDAISRAGLAGLSRFLADKTALEPGTPAGVDIETDELAFYPLIYWPVDAAAPMPSSAAIARVDAYMQQGGTVLFDTRDQYSGGGGTSPATGRLRDILGHMNVPALEPVPDDHVLTKAFYITPDFPGRYSGGPLWVEASLDASEEGRPVRTGDGVSPIMITANDLAGAWAQDASGAPMLPTVPADPMQRVWAYRGGVNIMMYMLTGNYKSDQVHIPILLERLGQ